MNRLTMLSAAILTMGALSLNCTAIADDANSSKAQPVQKPKPPVKNPCKSPNPPHSCKQSRPPH